MTRKNYVISFKRLLLIGYTVLIALNFTGCFFTARNDAADLTKIHRSDIVDREEEAGQVAKEYLTGKYGIEFTITNSRLRNLTNSTEGYHYHVNATASDENQTEFYLQVFPYQNGDSVELYVENDGYYGYAIKEKMERWLGKYLQGIGAETYILNFNGWIYNYPSDYAIDLPVEDIISVVSGNEDKRIAASMAFTVIIPEIEISIFSDENEKYIEFNNQMNLLQGHIHMSIVIYTSEDYEKRKSSEDWQGNAIDSYEIEY